MAEEIKDEQRVPPSIDGKLKSGRQATQREAAQRQLCWEYWKGNHHAYLDAEGALAHRLAGGIGVRGAGKPSWRSRLSVNLFRDHIENEVSAMTRRTPAYQVVPSTSDPEDISAAKLAQKIATYGHNKWKIQSVAERTIREAVVADEGFAWPYWDDTIGPFVLAGEEGAEEADKSEAGIIGLGDIKIKVFGANQVGWEPGMRFEDSPWHYVEYACTPEEVTQRKDYYGGKVTPDSDAAGSPTKLESARLVRVTEYLERPSLENPQGRWLVIANNRQVVPPRSYPCADYDFDGPVLHKLSYFPSDTDRDHGLGRDLVGPQFGYNDVFNKVEEWKNLALMPQLIVTPGLLKGQRFTDEPGAVYQIPDPDRNVKWRETPQIPQELFSLMELAERQMGRIASQQQIPEGVEAGKAIQVFTERDMNRRQSVLVRLAEWYSGLMLHCLLLVQKHYTEPRTLQIKGTAGWESERDFKGAKLRDQTDIRVYPDSIEPMTRQAIERRIMEFADRKWISPERAMQAIENGTAEALIEDIQNDRQRANRVIQRIKEEGEKILQEPMRVQTDPATSQPTEVPRWMPREFDNIAVHKYTFEVWMKTEDYERLPDPVVEVADLYYQGLLQLEAQQQARQAAQEQAIAAELGRTNATRTPSTGSPDMPVGDAGAESGIPTQNQPVGQR